MSHAVQTSWIDLAPGGFSGYLALPPLGRGPGLLLWQEIFGVNEHIRDVAQQYALAGFVVLAPDVFWRQTLRADLGYEGEERPKALALMQACTAAPELLLADIAQSAAALRARPEVDGRVGSIGFCMGGRLSYQAAATVGVDAAVAYYGGGIQGQLALAPRIACPMQFHYAGHDDHIPPDAVQAVREAMAGKDAEFHVYPDAAHGFNCWARSSYHAPSAALAHGRSLSFLTRCLFGG